MGRKRLLSQMGSGSGSFTEVSLKSSSFKFFRKLASCTASNRGLKEAKIIT